MDADSNTPLLLVEDDTKLCRLIREYLQPLGYGVTFAHNGADGLKMALEGSWSAVILDVMMPKLNGLEVLRELRKHSNVPVLMLTGLGDEADRIAGLELGADDYLPKTFSTRELLARLRAVIRRSRVSGTAPQPPAAQVVVGPLRICTETRTALLQGRDLGLTPVEFDLLLSLARSAGRIRTREQLLLETADRDFEAFDRSIDVHISSLRRKLGDDARSPQFIVTVRGAGYLMRRPGSDSAGEQ